MNGIIMYFRRRKIRKIRLARIREAQAYINRFDDVPITMLEDKVCRILNVSRNRYPKEIKSYMIALIVHEYPEERLLQELEKIDVKQGYK